MIDHCDPPIVSATMDRFVNHIKKYVRTGRDMRLNVVIGTYEMDEVVLDLGSKVNVMTR